MRQEEENSPEWMIVVISRALRFFDKAQGTLCEKKSLRATVR
jgi:hypothetical protein